MTHRSTPWPEPWPDPHPPPATASFETGVLLGSLQAESRRQTEILLQMYAELRELPERIAHAMPPPQPPAASIPSPAPPALKPERLSQWAELLRALWPLALIAAVVAGKISSPEALPIIRDALGIAAHPAGP